ncbi:MAG: hypothetical protein U1E73_02755 [Planctomycetota bacterium]
MASPRSSRSSSSRGSGGGRSSGSSRDSSQMMVYVGAFAVVVIVIFFVMRGGGSDGGSTQDPGASTPAAKPAAPAPQPAAAPTGSPKAGSKPATPAPALDAETMDKARTMLAKAKDLYNEVVNARKGGDNRTARDKASEAKAIVDEIKTLVEKAADWQMEAEMEGWSQPAEYVALGKVYGEVMNLANLIRKNGGQ